MFIKFTFIATLLMLITGCSLQGDPVKKDPRLAKLNSHRIPANCDYKKIFAFKVVCDNDRNVFGIDQSFVEAICESELQILEGLPQDIVYKFLNDRLAYFNSNWAASKEQSDYPYKNEMGNVKITAFVKNSYGNSVRCVLNNADDHIEVNAEVVPDCTNSDGIYHHAKCGVDINNIRVTNNNYVIPRIRMAEEGSVDPAIAYRLTSGYIYQGFFPLKKSNYSFSNYYSEDPTETNFYMRKDTSGFLDKYR